jgi:hypothetical protein
MATTGTVNASEIEQAMRSAAVGSSSAADSACAAASPWLGELSGVASGLDLRDQLG